MLIKAREESKTVFAWKVGAAIRPGTGLSVTARLAAPILLFQVKHFYLKAPFNELMRRG
jgi:hypothetical protein